MWKVETFIAECRLVVASTDSVVAACRLSSCSAWSLERTGSGAELRELSGCTTWPPSMWIQCSGAQAQLLQSMWDLSSPTRIQPTSPAVQGRSLTTGPSGKSHPADLERPSGNNVIATRGPRAQGRHLHFVTLLRAKEAHT